MINVKKWAVTLLPPITVILAFFLKKYVFLLAQLLPSCPFRMLTGYLCPGCGNTHSALCMLSGDLLTAVRYNATLPLIAAAAVLFYAEKVISMWIRPVRLLPRSVKFYIVLAVLFVAYVILRNFSWFTFQLY